MSFFKKGMASVFGVGGTKIDTIITSPSVKPGEVIEGCCKIKGGTVEQEITNINLRVLTSYEKEVDDSKITKLECIQDIEIDINRIIKPEEYVEVPFSFILDYRTPMSMHKSKVWIRTNLDISKAVDSGDKDYIEVLPIDTIHATLNAMSKLGFTIREVENIYDNKHWSSLGFVQEFEFIANTGQYRGKFDEIEMVFVPKRDCVDIYIEIDTKARGLLSAFAESVGLDETNRKIRLQYNQTNSNEIARTIQSLL